MKIEIELTEEAAIFTMAALTLAKSICCRVQKPVTIAIIREYGTSQIADEMDTFFAQLHNITNPSASNTSTSPA